MKTFKISILAITIQILRNISFNRKNQTNNLKCSHPCKYLIIAIRTTNQWMNSK